MAIFYSLSIIDGILFMLLLSLMFVQNLIPETSEQFLSVGILIFLMIYGGVKLLCSRKLIIRISKIDLLIVFTIGYFLVRSSISIGFYDLDLTITAALFLICYSFSKSISQFMYLRVTDGFIFAGVIIALIVLLQICHLLPSQHALLLPTGIFSNPAVSGFLLAGTLPLTFVHNSKFAIASKRLIWIFRVIIVMGLAATASRASWICCVVAILLLYRFNNTKKIRFYLSRHRYQIWGMVLVVIVLFGILLEIKHESAYSRLFIWKIAWQSFMDFPIWGVGKSFSYYYMDKQAAFLSTHPSSPFVNLCGNIHTCYNQVLQVLVQYGIIGLILCCCIIVLLYKGKTTEKNYVEKSIIIGLISGSMFSYATTSIPMLIMVSFYMGRISSNDTKENISLDIKRYKTWLIPFLFTALLVVMGYTYSLVLWGKARKLYYSSDYHNAVAVYDNLFPVLCTNGFFINEKAKCLFYVGEYEKSITTLQFAIKNRYSSFSEIAIGDNYKALNNFLLAEYAYKKAYKLVPNRVFALYCYALLLYDTEHYDEFIQLYPTLIGHFGKISSSAELEIKNHIHTLFRTLEK